MLNLPLYLYQGGDYYTKSYLLENYVREIEVDKQYWEKAAGQRHSKNLVVMPAKRVMMSSERHALALKDASLEALKTASIIANIGATLAVLFFLICGKKSKAKQHLTGRKISSAWLLAFKLKFTRKASPIKIGNVPLVKGSESQHMLITGGTGTEKSNCLHHILAQIRQQKQKVIIVDTTGSFLDRYYRADKDFM